MILKVVVSKDEEMSVGECQVVYAKVSAIREIPEDALVEYHLKDFVFSCDDFDSLYPVKASVLIRKGETQGRLHCEWEKPNDEATGLFFIDVPASIQVCRDFPYDL